MKMAEKRAWFDKVQAIVNRHYPDLHLVLGDLGLGLETISIGGTFPRPLSGIASLRFNARATTPEQAAQAIIESVAKQLGHATS